MWNHFPSGPYSSFFFHFQKNEDQSWALGRDFFSWVFIYWKFSNFFPQKLENVVTFIVDFFSTNSQIFGQKWQNLLPKKNTHTQRSWPFMIEMSKTWGTHSKQYLGSRAIQDPTIPFSCLIGSMHTCSLSLSPPPPSLIKKIILFLHNGRNKKR
jgi:hypothetical protein